jgi:hypothetical protein
LDKEQKNKIIDGMQSADKNEHEFNCQRLAATKEVELARIAASAKSGDKVFWIIVLAIACILIITMAVIFVKPEYLNAWLGFIMGASGGSFGGYGYANKQNKNDPSKTKNESE